MGVADVGFLGGVRGLDVLGDGDLAGQGGGDGGVIEQRDAGGVGRAQGDVALQVGVRGEDLAGKVPDDAQWRERRGGHTVRAQDSAVDGCGAAVGSRDETQGEAGAGEGVAGVGDDNLTVHPPGQQRQRPRQDGGGDPVGALLLTAGHGWEGRGGVECAGERVGEGHGCPPEWRRRGGTPPVLPVVSRAAPCAGVGDGAAHLVVSPGRRGHVSPMVGIVLPGLRCLVHRYPIGGCVRPRPGTIDACRDIAARPGTLDAVGAVSVRSGAVRACGDRNPVPGRARCPRLPGIVPGRRAVSPWMRDGRVDGAGRDGRTDDRRH